MKKRKITIEQRLNSKSPNIIWNLIGTPEGLGKWIADEIKQENGILTFTWGMVWSSHEIRRAKITECEKFCHIRFVWEDEDDEDAYVELRMEKNILTGEYTLHITDFAEEEDVDGLQGIWRDNMKRLHRTSGL